MFCQHSKTQNVLSAPETKVKLPPESVSNLNLPSFYTSLLSYLKIKTKFTKSTSVGVCGGVKRSECWRALTILLLDERVGYGLHTILRTDEHDWRSSADHQPQLPGVFCQLHLVVRIYQTHKFKGDVTLLHKSQTRDVTYTSCTTPAWFLFAML